MSQFNVPLWDKAWFRPPQYNDGGGGNQQAGVPERTEADIEAIINGPDEQRESRGGAGRPDPALADRSPMIYRDARRDDVREAVLDVDDREELTDGPAEYVPVPKPTHENVGSGYDPGARGHELVGRTIPPEPTSKFSIGLGGIIPSTDGKAVINLIVSGRQYTVDPDTLDAVSNVLKAWATAAKFMKI